MIPISIWIVEDDSTYRRTLQRMLERQNQITCTQVFPSCIEFLDAVAHEEHPDLVLMDLGLPKMNGIEGIKRLNTLAPDITVMVLTTFTEKDAVMEALENGAAGYLLKTATPQEIIKGIQDVFFGQSALSPSVAKILLEEVRKPIPDEDMQLSEREIEVLEQLAMGFSGKDIARNLDITLRTTRFHLTNIYEKMQVSSQIGAVVKAMQVGLIRPQ